MSEYKAITGEYKRQFIDDVLDGMSGFLDNKQLSELNKSLYYNTSNLDFADNPMSRDLDYDKTNKILISEFIKNKKTQGLSDKTIKYYTFTLEKFNEWCVKSFLEVTSEDIKDYLIFHKELNKCAKTTTNNIRRNLSSFFRYLVDEEKILINPIARVPPIKVPSKMKKAFTAEEIESMRWTLDSNVRNKYGFDEIRMRDRAIFELFLSSGIRVGELINIKLDDVDWENCKLKVLGKGNKERITYFSEKAKQNMMKYLSIREYSSPYLFTSQLSKGKLTINSVETQIRKIGQNSNVSECHPHKFRRTFCTNLVKKGMAIDQVQKLMGHESIEITLKYLEIDDEQIRMTHQKYTNF